MPARLRSKHLILSTQKGFSLIEILIVALVMTLVGLAVASAFIFGFQTIFGGKTKIMARAAANEQMEILRNMPYDDLATQNGTIYPPGNIPDNQEITKGNITFNVQTIIDFVDDPFDGDFEGTIPGKPVDLYPYDYKKIEIIATQKGKTQILAKLVSNVSAKASETATNTGILSIKVINSQGDPVGLAAINVTNTQLIPPLTPLNINTTTDISGRVAVPKLPPDSNGNYKIIAWLGGYSTDQTYPSTEANPHPYRPNVDIIVQQVTPLTLFIDRLSIMEITAIENTTGAILPGLALKIRGGKVIYEDPDVPKFEQTKTTDDQGKIRIEDLEWDSYTITPPAGYYVAATIPYQPVSLAAGTTLSATIKLTISATAPTISSIIPITAPNTDPIQLTISGTNFHSSTQVQLSKTGQTSISGTDISANPEQTELTCTLDLTGRETGPWDIVITNTDGKTVTQSEGFTIE
jgi:prepilin-type N-terminal cleavage/methylation domain-containing protein